jgi:aquaporin Z
MKSDRLTAGRALRDHWPEYLMEAWGLGTFMVSAGVFGTLLEAPASPVRQAIGDGDLRRGLMGIAMGLTAVCIIYSPWGKRSGAHINPAVTLTFLRLGKVKAVDAAFYGAAQFIGGTAGVGLAWALLGSAFADPPVHFVNTVPGSAGTALAFVVELAMACGLMLMVISALASERLMPMIGVFAGIMVAAYITVFAPISGMGINPARSFASALPDGLWGYLWIYFTAPVVGMLLAVEIHRAVGRRQRWFCAKLNHDLAYRCIHCGHVPAPVATEKTADAASSTQG